MDPVYQKQSPVQVDEPQKLEDEIEEGLKDLIPIVEQMKRVSYELRERLGESNKTIQKLEEPVDHAEERQEAIGQRVDALKEKIDGKCIIF